MRIIAGKYKRRKLYEVPHSKTRSTKDRVKETLFNMLGPYQHYAKTLDIFAGSGALGLEALSRFSDACTFVEVDASAYSVLKENIELLGVQETTNHYRMNAEQFLDQNTTTFDLIILDPPYQVETLIGALNRVSKKGTLSKNGVIATLSHKDAQIDLPNSLQIIKERIVGITKILLIEWSD